MTNLRLLTPSAACALGAALLVTTALQSTPAEARENASGHTARVIKPAVKQPHGEKRPAEKQPLNPGQQPSVTTQASFPTGPIATSASNPGPRATSTSATSSSGIKQPPIITATPTSIPSVTGSVATSSSSSSNAGGGKLPPVITATPVPIPPVTGPINPGNYPGGTRPPVIVATPIPIPPVTGPINPGYYPGGSRPPVIVATPVPIPTPIPVPIPTGSSHNPGYGTGTSTTHQYGQHGVYADIGAGGGDYESCRVFKSNYDRTGNAYWLNRYRVCLWQR